jgi:ATP-dependent Clp protease ATP-binding subunit ClpA
LSSWIVGQDEAIEQIVNIYQMHLTCLAAPGRPIGSFLFLGPTGSGKTRIVEATAQSLLGSPHAVVKVDCAEFQHSHEIAKLVGSPPGYLGHRETQPLLCQETLDQYHTENVKLSFVLFDEIEKASDAVWNLLLGILDKATLRLGDNRKVDFSRCMIFMTGNVGAAEMSSILLPPMGFTAAGAATGKLAGPIDAKLNEKISGCGQQAARRKFTPEFLNRIDKVVVFKPLGEPELQKILDLELKMVQERLLVGGGAPFSFALSGAARGHLLREGTDIRYGARHLKRAIERLLIQPLSNLIASEQVGCGDRVRVDCDPGLNALQFIKEAQGLPVEAVVEMARTPAVPPREISTIAAGWEPRSRRLSETPLGEVTFGE